MNARYRVNEQGYVVKNLQRREQVKPKPEAENFENATGEKSVQRIAQERGHAVIQSATCWEELHAGLDAVGLRFVRKGSSAVIFVGDTAVKASSVDRKFSMSRLVKRLGEFKSGTTLHGHSASPPRSRSATFAGRSGWSIRRSGKSWPKQDASPERNGRKNGTNWSGGNGNAAKLPQPILPRTGFPC